MTTPDLTPEELAVIAHEARESGHPAAEAMLRLLDFMEVFGMGLPPVPDEPWERDALLESARRKAGMVDDEPWKGG